MGKILHAYKFAWLDNEGFKYFALMTANSKKSEIYYPNEWYRITVNQN